MTSGFQPSYLALYASGELHKRVRQAQQILSACTLCPRMCGVNRIAGEKGYCGALAQVRVASWNVHRWEEPPISGTEGSGTVFFSFCTSRCTFCQNYPISQLGSGKDFTQERLGGMMLELQRLGCHNINLVTPTHYVPQILAAVESAAKLGLHIPLVYNTSGYDRVETLRLLEGVIDIYLPDSKYADDTVAARLSGYRSYVVNNRLALLEMYRQVGDTLLLDDREVALHGMIIRHLVLPDGLAQTGEVLRWIAANLSNRVHISLMSQYYPAWRAVEQPELNRTIREDEYQAALAALEGLGFDDGWLQELE